MCFNDYEPSSVWDAKIVKARKPHQCDECGRAIPKGEHYERVGSLCDGSWQTLEYCRRCKYYQHLLHLYEHAEGCEESESWYPMGAGEMRRYMRQDLGWELPEEI